MGGTMRLGLRPTVFEEGTESWSQARKLYGGADKIWERHRHRYEVNPKYVEQLTNSGLVFSGKDEKGERMQILELRGKFFVFYTFLIHVERHIRSSLLPGLASTPRVLYTTTQPITSLPWICRRVSKPSSICRGA